MLASRTALRISAHAHTPAHYFDRQLFRGQYDQNMNVVYIVHKNAKMQIKIKMSIQNTIDSVPVCICDFRSAGIHFPMSHWMELMDTQSMWANAKHYSGGFKVIYGKIYCDWCANCVFRKFHFMGHRKTHFSGTKSTEWNHDQLERSAVSHPMRVHPPMAALASYII